MKVVSWNVNGFRSVATKYTLSQLISKYSPDILFLQEMKSTGEQALALGGQYINCLQGDYAWSVCDSTIPGRHGVAMFIKNKHAFNDDGTATFRWLRNDLVDPKVDGQRESRLQAFVIKDILFINTYSVNVRPDLSRLSQRSAYDNQIANILQMWKDQGNDKVIIVGDFNVVSELKDYHGAALSLTTPGMTDSERSSFKVILNSYNLKDSFRELNPDEDKYSYWSYRGYARENNKGWRLDYALVSESLMKYVELSDILTDIEGSDHAPIILELKDL